MAQRDRGGAAEALQTQGLPYVTLVHLLCQRHRQLTTHASKMRTTNRAEHTKRLYTVWTDQMYGAKNVVWNHTHGEGCTRHPYAAAKWPARDLVWYQRDCRQG